MALVGSLEEDAFVPHSGLKRLVKGGSRRPNSEAKDAPARARCDPPPPPPISAHLKADKGFL